MDFYASTSTTNKLYENDVLVDYKNFETNYDGEQLQAEYQDNNTIYYTKLNNDELSKVMMFSNNNSNLDIRLLNDFPITNKKSKPKTLSKRRSKRSKKNNSIKNKIASINDTIY